MRINGAALNSVAVNGLGGDVGGSGVIVTTDFAMAVESLAQCTRDFALPCGWISSVVSDNKARVDWLASVGSTTRTPVGFGVGIGATTRTPVEWLGQRSIDTDVRMPVDWRVGVQPKFKAHVAWTATIVAGDPFLVDIDGVRYQATRSLRGDGTFVLVPVRCDLALVAEPARVLTLTIEDGRMVLLERETSFRKT